jgi:transcriptional regulator with XRE-family HTH domain
MGDRVRALRYAYGMTQAELTDAMNVHVRPGEKPTALGTVKGLEKNRHEPDLRTVRRCAQVFGVSIDFLTGMEHRARGAAAPKSYFEWRDKDAKTLPDPPTPAELEWLENIPEPPGKALDGYFYTTALRMARTSGLRPTAMLGALESSETRRRRLKRKL